MRTRLFMLASDCALRSCFSWRSLCSSRCLVATSSFRAAFAVSKLHQIAKALITHAQCAAGISLNACRTAKFCRHL